MGLYGNLALISLCLQRVSFTVIFPVASVSLSGSERLAGEDGCNSGYCFGASESFVSKISVFSNVLCRWFMS